MAEQLLLGFQNIWEGLGSEIYEWFISPVLDFFNMIWDRIVEFFQNLGRTIYNAIVSFVDSAITFIEYTLNSIRQYLPYAIMITISWTLVTRTWKSEKLSLFKKIAYTILAPVIGYLTAKVFDAMVPLGVQLPRLSIAIQPTTITTKYNHKQYINESVELIEIKPLTITAEYNHTQFINDIVRLEPTTTTVEASYNHIQFIDDVIRLIERITVQESYNHTQTYYHTVNLL